MKRLITILLLASACLSCKQGNVGKISHSKNLDIQLFNQDLKRIIEEYVVSYPEYFPSPKLLRLDKNREGNVNVYQIAAVTDSWDFIDPNVLFFFRVNDLFVGYRDMTNWDMGIELSDIISVH